MNEATVLILGYLFTSPRARDRWHGKVQDRGLKMLRLEDDLENWFTQEYLHHTSTEFGQFWPMIRKEIQWPTVRYYLQEDLIPNEVKRMLPEYQAGREVGEISNPLFDRSVKVSV